MSDLKRMVDELTRPYTHREPYSVQIGPTRWQKYHVTEIPSLVHQLLHATPASSETVGPRDRASRPAAHIEALDTLAHIDLAAARWVRDLGEFDPIDAVDPKTGLTLRGSGTIACLNKLHGLSASASTTTRLAIEADVKRWWTQARIITGWDSPAWRPDSTCPACGVRGGLRVRLSPPAALCVATLPDQSGNQCREIWDQSTIGLLAEHIRTENVDHDEPEEVAS